VNIFRLMIFIKITISLYKLNRLIFNSSDDKPWTAVCWSCHTVYLVVGVVVPEPCEHSISALSVGLCQVSELEIGEIGWRVFGAVEHQAMALAVVSIIKHNALVFSAVDVGHYHWLDGLECGRRGTGWVSFAVVVFGAVHYHRVHVDAAGRIRHVGTPWVVALHAQRNRWIPVVVGRVRYNHRQCY